jgi:DNA-binding MarR family transcriptional regulator
VNGATAKENLSRRSALALLLAVLMLASVPSLATAAEDSGFSLSTTIDDIPTRDWYIAGDELNISVLITNDGDAASLTSNPSCPAALSAYSQSGDLLWDGLESAGCRQQSRGTDFTAGEVIDWADLSWNFTDSNGNYLPPGMLTLVVTIPDTDLSTNSSADPNSPSGIEVLWQAPVEIDATLELELVAADSPSGTFSSAEGLFAAVRVYNSGNSELTQFTSPDCNLRFTAWQNEIVLVDRLSEMPCDGGLGGEVFAASQLSDYGWLNWDFRGDDGTEADSGEVLIEVGLPDRSRSAQTTVTYSNLGAPANAQLSSPDSPLIPGVIFSIAADQSGNVNTNGGESLGFTGILTNTGEQAVTASFANMCRIEIFILNSDGAIVYDTRDGRECRDVDIDHFLEPGAQFSINHAQWPLVDRSGCGLVAGVYTVVVDVPEFHLRTTSEFIHSDDGTAIACLGNAQDSDATFPLLLSEPSIALDSTESLNISIALTGGEDTVDLLWVSPCRLGVDIVSIDSLAVVGGLQTWCGAEPAERLRIAPLGVVSDEAFSLLMLDAAGEPLVSGDYRLDFRVNALPTIMLQYQLAWPLEDDVVTETDSDDSADVELAEEIIPTTLSGTWMYVTTENGGCWILNSGGKSHLLLDATAVSPWIPQPKTIGTYRIVDDPRSAPECPDWENHISIIEVLQEQALPTESEVAGGNDDPVVIIENSIIEEVAPTVVAVVVSTSVLSLLVMTVIGNESWRIPLSQLGLGLIGLIGRTHETNDGKYQRGRLMGYLTANPGCHFRALMAALDMSNGQITHHLKILEEEDVVWRRKDGRLMRFYPATIGVDTPVEDLPIPALTPDANSLQGKILRILDNDGQMGTYPTQHDLADRLERSQQLISHHLRTLHKYGLIEKSRSGLKNRYKLTKEAIFLLNQP